MTLSRRLEVLVTAVDIGVLPLFFTPDPERALAITGALREGGATVIEFTDRGPGAWTVFERLAQEAARHDPGAILGAGSVRDVPAADRFIASGARFIVGPSFSADVARLCNRRRVPYLPGCATPTEIVAAEESGVELIKVFPGDTLGPGFVKAVLGPLPETRIVVTGGVQATEASVRDWIGAGAACLGFGSALVAAAHTDPASGADVAAITPAVAAVIALVAAARTDGPGGPR
ncbi:MAG: bifunctional 4-hydroxy-2-oxoglutarate aldolase/2-dehydro-3-deoxy-phosphogluconate aldolase [Chloroflexota bacterium]|jgi:2-dehydro-3-deoxyphosphogluconate aldolase/(4S)-4-hydroxy-2-oxoglutarate aldolase